MNGILNRIFVFIDLPAYVSGAFHRLGQGGDNEGMLFPLFEPLKPIRFLLPVKKDTGLEREGELNKWNWEGASYLHARGALGK